MDHLTEHKKLNIYNAQHGFRKRKVIHSWSWQPTICPKNVRDKTDRPDTFDDLNPRMYSPGTQDFLCNMMQRVLVDGQPAKQRSFK